jgi:23S rRNA (guanosine2251-2'-O)-methyltransferase
MPVPAPARKRRAAKRPKASAGQSADSYCLYGVHAVAAALAQRPQAMIRVALLPESGNRRVLELADKARGAGVPVAFQDQATLDVLAGGGLHQGIVAEVALPPERSERQLRQLDLAAASLPLLLVLDGVQDPHNLGACLRTADAAGAQGVIVPKDGAVGLTPVVCRVACGGAERVPLYRVTNLARTLVDLKEQGVWLVGTAAEATDDLYQLDLVRPLALVMGSEGSGLRRLTREHCDFLARLPMRGSVSSLNVSVSAGICLYEALRQRD